MMVVLLVQQFHSRGSHGTGSRQCLPALVVSRQDGTLTGIPTHIRGRVSNHHELGPERKDLSDIAHLYPVSGRGRDYFFAQVPKNSLQ